jgi:hypothetical protein
MTNMFPQIAFLAKPEGDEQISEFAFGYVSEAAREEIFDYIVKAMIESGITKATLAKRLGKDPAQVTRILQAPANWTVDTLAELLFAIDGRMFRPDAYLPSHEPVANQRFAKCLEMQGEDYDLILETSIPNSFIRSTTSLASNNQVLTWQ